MSRATRPRTHLGPRRRLALARALGVERLVAQGVRLWPSSLARAAERLGVRATVLRRCLLGREVSTKAAARVLRAART